MKYSICWWALYEGWKDIALHLLPITFLKTWMMKRKILEFCRVFCCKLGPVPHLLIEGKLMYIYRRNPTLLGRSFGVVGSSMCATLVLSLRAGGVELDKGLSSREFWPTERLTRKKPENNTAEYSVPNPTGCGVWSGEQCCEFYLVPYCLIDGAFMCISINGIWRRSFGITGPLYVLYILSCWSCKQINIKKSSTLLEFC